MMTQMHENLLQSMQHLLRLVPNMESRTDLKDMGPLILSKNATITKKNLLKKEDLIMLNQLWELPVIENAFRHSNMQFSDNVKYFYGRMKALIGKLSTCVTFTLTTATPNLTYTCNIPPLHPTFRNPKL